MMDHRKLFVGGQWKEPSSDKFYQVVGAATEEPIGRVPEASEVDVDRAMAAARSALSDPAWRDITPAERGALIGRFADELEQRAAELTSTVSQENGMPISLSTMLEGQFAIGMLRYYGELSAQQSTEEIRPSQMGVETVVRRVPKGVVAAIVPWNYPVVLAISKIGPALAAGCTVVVKPSPPGTLLDAYILAEAAEAAGLPGGVVNWVPGGRDIGAYMVSHPEVDKVSFTGSTAAGRSIAGECAKLLRPVTLELGGKSAAIVLDDTDLDQAMAGIQFITFINNGQTCVTCSRLLAPRSRYDEVVEALGTMVNGLKIGDPLDESTEIGPMAFSGHRDRVEQYIEKGKAEARLVAGGGRPQGFGRGYFVEPTLFADVDNRATIAQEEIFGPVLAVIPYDDDADAVRIANDSAYGLGGSVFSADVERAKSVARRIDTGTIGINGYPVAIGSPFGGMKDSGMGREFGPEALASYVDLQSIYVG